MIRPLVRTLSRSVSLALDYSRESAAPPVVIPDPTTVQFTSAQVAPGFTGSISTTKNAARIYMRGELALWSGYISGTEAKMTIPSDFGDNPGSIQVAVDGGAFISAPNAASVYTLFSGLPHAKHFVEMRVVLPMGDAAYIAATGNVLQVTGTPPSLETLANKVQVGDNTSTKQYSGVIVANNAGYTPPLQGQKGQNYGSNVGSIRLRGAFSKLVVTVGGDRKIAVSKNGAAPIYYTMADEANSPPRAMQVPCDGTEATYYVWDDGNGHSIGGHFAVAGDSTLLDLGTFKQIHQYGDSITFGSGPGATTRNVEIMRVAAELGYLGGTNGISGLTIVGCSTLLDTVLPLRTVSANDVAILAIGGNSMGDGLDQTDLDAYLACINKLKAKGYGKVVCRAVLAAPDGSSSREAENAPLKAIVDGLADPNVVWLATHTWTGYETQDNTHPTAKGYEDLDLRVEPALRSILGL